MRMEAIIVSDINISKKDELLLRLSHYFITHENYNVMKIDIVLFDYGLDPLTKNS